MIYLVYLLAGLVAFGGYAVAQNLPMLGQQISWHQGFARSAAESAYPNLWRSLLGAWVPALGPTGMTLRDLSGHGHHGTLTNMDPATDWVIPNSPRVSGHALDFDGIDDYVDFTSTSFHPYTWEDFSFVAWYKSNIDTSLDDQYIFASIDKSGNWNENKFAISDDSGHVDVSRLQMRINDSWETVYGNTDIVDQQWHHLAATRAGTQVRLFVDGNQDASGTISTAASVTMDSTGPWIGDQPGYAELVDGQLALVLVYDRALSPADILLLYQQPLAPFLLRQDLVAYVPTAPPAVRRIIIISKILEILNGGNRKD